MSVPAPVPMNTTNYLVPAAGTTHAVIFAGQFSATPFPIDWRQFKIDQFPFQPQGVFIDNTSGTVDLVITVNPINWRVVCPAGSQLEASFPAPNGQTCQITGDPANSATVIFVDFPVLPSAGVVRVQGTVNTAITSIGATVMNANDNPMAAANTLPYRTQEYVPAADFKSGSIFGSNVNTTLTPSFANQNLRKLLISISGDAFYSGSAEIAVTVTANGANCFSRTIILPTAAPTTTQPAFSIASLDFDAMGIHMAAGNLVVTISAALSGGVIDVNAYFTPQ